MHHTPKKEVKINNTAGLEKLKNDFLLKKNTLQQELIKLETAYATLNSNIEEIDILIKKIKKGEVMLDEK